MLFSRFVAVAATTLFSLVSAASTDNAFSTPTSGDTLVAGKPFTIKWGNMVGSTVTLTLRNGNEGDLTILQTIAENIPNSGSYTWLVPATQAHLQDGTIAISWGAATDASKINFSGRFVLDSDVTTSVSSSTVSLTSTLSSTSGTSSTVMTTTSTSTTAVSTSTTTTGSTNTSSAASSSSASSVSSSKANSSSAAKTSSTSTSSASPTTSSPSASVTAPNSGNNNLASPLAIILCIMAAVMYTN